MKYGVTDKGFLRKNLNDIISDIEEKMNSRGYSNFTINPYSGEGVLLGIIAEEFAKSWQGLEESYNSRYLDFCFNMQLDRHGKNFELYRIIGKYATTTLEFKTSSELKIPKGTYVKIRNTDLIFQTTSDLIIDSSFEGQVQAIALEYGTEYNSPVGSITELVTSVIGVVSVTNIIASTGGDGIENDDSYREAIKMAGKSRGGSTVDAITLAIRSIRGVSSVLVIENPGDVVDEYGIQPGHFKVWIEGIASYEIAKAIHNVAALGIQTEGNIVYQVENIGGQIIDVKFNMFRSVEIFVKLKIISSEKTAYYLRDDIKKNIYDYIKNANFRRGRKIVHNQVEAKAYDVDDGINELEITMGIDPDNLSKDSIVIPFGDLYYATIEVEDGTR